jgi:hypothetical protein
VKRMILLAPVILFLAGCATTHVRVYNAAGLTGEADARDIPVFQDGQSPGKSHRILGQVFAERRWRGNSDQGLADILRGPAARMGADAIIGAQFNKGFNGWKWATGLAVKYVEGDEGTAAPPEYTVVVLAVVDERVDSADRDEVGRPKPKNDSDRAAGERAQDRATFRWLAEYHLQRLGYFTRIVPDSLTRAQIRAMDSESRRRIGGEDTAMLLLLTFGESSGYNAGFVAEQSVMLHAALISKETGASVWENSAEGSSAALGLLDALSEGGGVRRTRAIAGSASKIFRTLELRSKGARLDWYE